MQLHNILVCVALLLYVSSMGSVSAQLESGRIPEVTIAEAKQFPFGSPVSIRRATIVNLVDLVESPFFRSFQVDDGTGAITLFGDSVVLGAAVAGLNQGDIVDIQGLTGCFRGLAQIDQLAGPAIFSVIDTGIANNPVRPIPISTTDLLDFSNTAEQLESRLVTLNQVCYLDSGNPSNPGAPFVPVANYLVTDGDINVTARIATTFIGNTLGNVPSGPVRLTGVFSQFSDCKVGNTVYQFLVLDLVVLGDVDGSGVADLLDVATFVDILGTGSFAPAADINNDGVVNLLDVSEFIELLSN